MDDRSIARVLAAHGINLELAEKAMAIDDAPVVIDFTVGKDAQVWPMVAAGASNDEIQAARDLRPEFEEDE